MPDLQIVQTTAAGAAFARAAHRLLDGDPKVFDDPLAAVLLGPDVETAIDYMTTMGTPETQAGSRALIVGRARYVEDRLAAAVARGVRQYVILGAGLDSFAHRDRLGTRVFEVDLPELQAWKRKRYAACGLKTPDTLVYVPTDFESESAVDALRRSAFDFGQPSFVAWAGVVPYLTAEAIDATLAAIASFQAGTELVLSYVTPPRLWDPLDRLVAEFIIPSAESLGEPIRSFHQPEDIAAVLDGHGFADLTHFGPHEAALQPYYRNRTDLIRPCGFERCIAATIPLRAES
jgi:methyltransferase (TIGR00027 family)